MGGDRGGLWLGASYQASPGITDLTMHGTLTNISGPDTRKDDVDFHESLPDIIRVGARYRPRPQIEVRLFGDYTRWSKLTEQCITLKDRPCGINNDGTAAPGTGTVVDVYRGWRDTFGVRAGASYWAKPRVELFAGLGFERSAIPDNTLDPALPDADTMLELRYRDSPIVGQDRPSIWSTDVVHSGRVEAPALADWAAFGDGPAPGDRAPEVVFGEGAAGWSRMGDVLRGPKHALLLFDGAAATAEGYRNLAAIAGHIEKSYGDVIAVHVIVPSAEKPEALAWSGSMVLDADDAVHRRYGARSECLYLIRPDGYVAYRCQPASDEKLGAYLQAIYKSAQ